MKTNGRILLASCIAVERLNPGSYVETAASVGKERLNSGGYVLAASVIVEEGLITIGRVPNPIGEILECPNPLSRVAQGIPSVRRRAHGSSRRRKRKAAKQDWDEKESKPQRRPARLMFLSVELSYFWFSRLQFSAWFGVCLLCENRTSPTK